MQARSSARRVSDSAAPDSPASPRARGARLALVAVVVLLVAETLAIAAAEVVYIVDLTAQAPSSVISAWALFVVIQIGVLWIAVTTVGTFMRRRWARAAAIVWQVLQVSVAFTWFSAATDGVGIGWAILGTAAVCLALLLWPGIPPPTATPPPLTNDGAHRICRGGCGPRRG